MGTLLSRLHQRDSNEELQKEIDALNAEVERLKSENERLKQKLPESKLPKGRIDDRYFEKLSEKCRPSKVAQLYSTLENQEWVDAMETLQGVPDLKEDDIMKFLCAIVMTAFQSCQEVYNDLRSIIAQLLREPTLVVNDPLMAERNRENKLPDDVTDIIGHHLRQGFNNIDHDKVVKKMCEKLTLEFTKFVQPQHENQLQVVQKYMNQCAKVIWQMIIQHPPMWLSVDDQEFDDEKHKLYWSCKRAESIKINYYVWPALYDYERGKLLSKGCVYVS